MDSINQNQPEENREDLFSGEAVERIKEMVKKAETCFFNTSPENAQQHGTRPMNVLDTDEAGNLWFLSASDSRKNQEIMADSTVKLFFQGSKHSDFLYITGKAKISKDKEKISKLWNPILKTWFTEGENDPRITVIQFIPEEGYYWDNKHGNAIAGIKILIGAAIGKTLDDSIEGDLKV